MKHVATAVDIAQIIKLPPGSIVTSVDFSGGQLNVTYLEQDVKDSPVISALRKLGLKEIEAELNRAIAKHGSLKSTHEAYAVLLEEVRELEREVFNQDKNIIGMRREATHVAAIAWRMLIDVL